MGTFGKREDSTLNGKDEVRSCRLEVRAQSDGHIKGYPILFNSLSEDLGGFRERILPDAIQFADDLAADFNHNPDYILGRVRAGTMKVSTDARGVYMDVNPPDTTWARDLKVSIKRGDIDKGSFGFRVLPGGQQITEENGEQVRTLSKILVRRLSVVSDPAYTKTSIEARNRSMKPPQVSGGAPKQACPIAPLSVYQRRQALFDLE
jgi:HK97 family phage prohead protease